MFYLKVLSELVQSLSADVDLFDLRERLAIGTEMEHVGESEWDALRLPARKSFVPIAMIQF